MIAPVDNPLIGFLLLTAVSSFDPGLGSGVGVGFVVDGVGVGLVVDGVGVGIEVELVVEFVDGTEVRIEEKFKGQTTLDLSLSVIIFSCPDIFEFAWKKLLSSKSINKRLILSEVFKKSNPSSLGLILSKSEIVQLIIIDLLYFSGNTQEQFLILSRI